MAGGEFAAINSSTFCLLSDLEPLSGVVPGMQGPARLQLGVGCPVGGSKLLTCPGEGALAMI